MLYHIMAIYKSSASSMQVLYSNGRLVAVYSVWSLVRPVSRPDGRGLTVPSPGAFQLLLASAGSGEPEGRSSS